LAGGYVQLAALGKSEERPTENRFRTGGTPTGTAPGISPTLLAPTDS
jgi:hypothetical protein